ncbi:MAG: sugar transferase, partial [Planctomycetota bacterium]|nr:sugar transferase [Planctomycetota bacterium]
LITAYQPRALFVAIPSLAEERLEAVQKICRATGTACLHVPLFIVGSLRRFEMALVGDVLLLQERPVIAAGIPWLLKRAFDLAIAIPLLVLTSPIMLLAGLLIKISSPGPIFFAQERLGLNGKPFTLYKLRTMAADAPAYATKEEASASGAIFAVGKFLRRTSIDELPQLWNVIRGEMSLVGPRPEMPNIAATYDRFQRERLRLPPGMTGLWQISASRNQPIHENLDYDLYYVYNRSFLLDLVILFRTIFCLGSGK